MRNLQNSHFVYRKNEKNRIRQIRSLDAVLSKGSHSKIPLFSRENQLKIQQDQIGSGWMLLDRGSLLVIVHEEGLVRGWNQCVLETSRYFLAKNTLIFYCFLMILDWPSRRWVCPENSQKVSKTRFRDFHTPRRKSKNKMLFLWKLEISIFVIFWRLLEVDFRVGTFWNGNLLSGNLTRDCKSSEIHWILKKYHGFVYISMIFQQMWGTLEECDSRSWHTRAMIKLLINAIWAN